MSNLPTAEEFMRSNLRNAYVREGDYVIYLRQHHVRIVGGRKYRSLDIANIANVADGARSCNVFRDNAMAAASTGRLRALLARLNALAASHDVEILYVENVLNEFLPAKLVEYGFEYATPIGFDPPSFWRHVKKS